LKHYFPCMPPWPLLRQVECHFRSPSGGGGVRQWGVRRSGHLGGHLSPARVRACVRVAHGPECVQHVSRECAPRHTPTTHSGRYRTTRRECSAKTKDRNLQGVARGGGLDRTHPHLSSSHTNQRNSSTPSCVVVGRLRVHAESREDSHRSMIVYAFDPSAAPGHHF
jgi:hypothetical protein